MEERRITIQHLKNFNDYLLKEEKSVATIDKYLRDVHTFFCYANTENITKEITVAYKKHLEEKQYAIRSINSMLASLNSFLGFMGWTDLRVKFLKMQREIYCSDEKQLTKQEYIRLLNASADQPQLNLVLQTICGTGIRISELRFFTLKAVCQGKVIVSCKNKSRIVLLPKELQRLLLNYAKGQGIKKGAIFITRNGRPLDRSNIWTQMKRLCKKAKVNPEKVFPHNLRKLFARTFYKIEKDIAKLADILGHGSIETTRIYIMSTGDEHQKILERLGLIV